jgi:hypothetical protein
MFDLSRTNMNSQQQALLATATVVTAGLSVYYATSASRKKTDEHDTTGAYKPIPTPGSKYPYVGMSKRRGV